MSYHSEHSPDTLSIDLTDGGIAVEYTDGREAFYHGVPAKVEESHTTAPGKEVHVLVTDPTETEGVLVYVNDRTTVDEIITETGVGRVLVDDGEETTLFRAWTCAPTATASPSRPTRRRLADACSSSRRTSEASAASRSFRYPVRRARRA